MFITPFSKGPLKKFSGGLWGVGNLKIDFKIFQYFLDLADVPAHALLGEPQNPAGLCGGIALKNDQCENLNLLLGQLAERLGHFL